MKIENFWNWFEWNEWMNAAITGEKKQQMSLFGSK